ncbi:MAG: Fic/DOC family protein [Alkaliphilus sp.]
MSDRVYCYPNTSVLVNKLDIKDCDELKKVELIRTKLRIDELYFSPVKGNYDLAHLQKIHQYIFQDIYGWAGKLRTVDIAKDNTLFALERHIYTTAEYIFSTLKKESILVDKKNDVEKYADRLAFYSGEINMLHPFREGNGRSLREFIRCLAKEGGYEINWSKFDKEDVYSTFVKSTLDYKPLKEVFKAYLVKCKR